ncbi:ribonuclease P protein component [Blattabacterium cuenoti]|uniref:ribonuclease P protein component n=1 Tax=Blattabacterium cuenoti TaxID=1653831 RepID=UPI00163CF7B1|nr:ribonuclease P protein component [Blattabacterium cuenoti]
MSLKINVMNVMKYGKLLYNFPIKIKYISIDKNKSTNYVKNKMVGILIKKQIFKKAVHRNRIKRLFRSAYLLNKYLLEDNINNNNKIYYIVFIYQGSFLPTFKLINCSLNKICSYLKFFVK